MVRVNDGVLVILPGQGRDAGDLRHALDQLGPLAVVGDVVAVGSAHGGVQQFHSRAWGPQCLVREVWSLAARRTDNLVLARLAETTALLALLEAARTRPKPLGIRALASTCISVPQFRATVPRGVQAVASTLRSYQSH